jgi:hypothetical protein
MRQREVLLGRVKGAKGGVIDVMILLVELVCSL